MSVEIEASAEFYRQCAMNSFLLNRILGITRMGGIRLLLLFAIVFFPGERDAVAQSAPDTNGESVSSSATQGRDKQINVNWFYGSYVPKEVSLESLTNHQRFQLYVRQTYTTWGIYIKTLLFTTHDQVRNTNPEWGDGFEGFAKRFGTRQVQFIVQNTTTSLGDGLLGWEPRYDRCRCDGFWPRTRHAVVRNFVTYAGDEKSLRPQLMPYVGSFVGGMTTATWQPGKTRIYIAGYQGAITQVFVGAGINWIGEFAPEIGRILRPRRKAAHASVDPSPPTSGKNR